MTFNCAYCNQRTVESSKDEDLFMYLEVFTILQAQFSSLDEFSHSFSALITRLPSLISFRVHNSRFQITIFHLQRYLYPCWSSEPSDSFDFSNFSQHFFPQIYLLLFGTSLCMQNKSLIKSGHVN